MSEQDVTGPVPVNGDISGSGSDRIRELLADRRALAVLGAALLGLILLVAFVVVPALTGSSGAKSASPVAKGVPRATPTPSPTASASSSTPTVTQVNARDPFAPLAVEGAGSGNGGVVTATAGATSAAAQVNATNIRQLTLTAITGSDTAQVTVNGLAFNVTLNTPFDGGFLMTKVTDSAATFTYNGQTQTLVPSQYAFFS